MQGRSDAVLSPARLRFTSMIQAILIIAITFDLRWYAKPICHGALLDSYLSYSQTMLHIQQQQARLPHEWVQSLRAHTKQRTFNGTYVVAPLLMGRPNNNNQINQRAFKL